MRIKLTPRKIALHHPDVAPCCRASEVSIRKAPALQDQSSQQRSQSQESEAEPQVTPVPATSQGPARPSAGPRCLADLTMFSDKQNWKVGLFDVDWFSWIWGLDEDMLNYDIYIYIMTYTDII